MTRKKQFSLALMSPSILVLIIVLWLLPLSFLVHYFVSGQRFIGGIALFLFAMYILVWQCCRPSAFSLSSNTLELIFPVWKRSIPFKDITAVRIISSSDFKAIYGWAMRIGVGGLWGGFGWLWTSKGGFIEFYVSRVDGFVLIERETGNNLLITPENQEEFVKDSERLKRRS